MFEQADVPAERTVRIATAARVLSNEVRASLEAVREAQEVARVRERRRTTQARLWFAALVGVVVLGAVVLVPRVVRWRHAPAKVATAARPSSTPALLAPSIASPEPARPALLAPSVASPAPARPEPVAAAIAVPAAAQTIAAVPALSAPAEIGERRTDCDAAFIRKAPWLLSPEACARAFASDSRNAPLALAIAHAEYVRGHFADGATWAKRALALDPKAAEAYVLIARAEAAGGRTEEARAAYRRYLELAPHGWHKVEARTGVRPARLKPPVDSSR